MRPRGLPAWRRIPESAWTPDSHAGIKSGADDYTEFNPVFPLRIDGKVENSLAKSTRVYAKTGGQWKLVHANFAPVVAPQN
jgi:hypothetical protein